MTGSPTLLIGMLVAASLVPFALVMMTSFVKMAVVLSIVRSALGAQQVPPGSVITGLALVLSLAVMAPVAAQVGERLEQAWPQLATASPRELLQSAQSVAEPLHAYLQAQAHPKNLQVFSRLLPGQQAEGSSSWRVLVPAFVISQLEEAFRMGFVIYLPFLVLDMLIGSILLSLGMHMLSPATVSLPFKLLLFVFADGWSLIGASLLGGNG